MSSDRMREYREKPWYWFRDYFGDAFQPTTQQKQYLDELSKLSTAKLKLHRGDKLTNEEEAYSKKLGISIMSGTGTGKDAITALTIIWFLIAMSKDTRVVATGLTGKHLRNVLWAEISKWIHKSRNLRDFTGGSTQETTPVCDHMLAWQTERVFFKEYKGQACFAEAVTVNKNSTREEQASSLLGRHATSMLMVFDEAAAIPDPVFENLEHTLTKPNNYCVMIFNPIKTTGFAIKTHYEQKDRWIALRWNSEDSEIVNKAHLQNMKEKYGVDSNQYRVKVLGLPPVSEGDALINWDWVTDSIDRNILPSEDDACVAGVDVGGGGDKSVFCVRRGGMVIGIKRNSSKDTMEVARWVAQLSDEYKCKALFVDSIGLGRGVYDRLREMGYKAYSADSRGRSRRSDRFVNARAEMYWTLRSEFEGGRISIPNDDDLIEQLQVIKYKIDGTGKTQILKKDALRAMLEGDSPDEADALAMTYYMPDRMFRSKTETKDYEDAFDFASGQSGWMGR